MTVYPRVGGGTEQVANMVQAMVGLSPRGRGNPKLLPLSIL